MSKTHISSKDENVNTVLELVLGDLVLLVPLSLCLPHPLFDGVLLSPSRVQLGSIAIVEGRVNVDKLSYSSTSGRGRPRSGASGCGDGSSSGASESEIDGRWGNWGSSRNSHRCKRCSHGRSDRKVHWRGRKRWRRRWCDGWKVIDDITRFLRVDTTAAEPATMPATGMILAIFIVVAKSRPTAVLLNSTLTHNSLGGTSLREEQRRIRRSRAWWEKDRRCLRSRVGVAHDVVVM